MGLPQNLEEMENCKPTFVTTDTSGGSVTNINGDYTKGQRLEVNGDYIACANINVNPPDPKEQNGRFRHLPSCIHHSSNPPPDLISPWVFVVFVICLISICGLVIRFYPRGAFFLHQLYWMIDASNPCCSCAAHDQCRSHGLGCRISDTKASRADSRTFGWTPEWVTQEVDISLANLQEVNRSLAQLYLLLENKLSAHVGSTYSGQDANGMFAGSDAGPEVARVLMCRARSEGGKGGAKKETKGPEK